MQFGTGAAVPLELKKEKKIKGNGQGDGHEATGVRSASPSSASRDDAPARSGVDPKSS
jgi:hypothetical protein